MPFEGVKAGPPPRKDGTAPSAPARRASGKMRAREEAANGVFQILGYGALLAGWHADAGAINNHGPALAHGLAETAETDAAIAKGLDSLLTVGPYGNLIILGMPLVLQVLANHKILKPEMLAAAGVVHPEALAADVKAALAEQAREALQRQREAEERLRATQAELAADAAGANGSAPDMAHT